MRVLLTGSSGTVAWPVCEALRERGHFVRGFDRAAPPDNRPLDEQSIGDVTDQAQLLDAAKDVDAIMHFACAASDQPFLEALLPVNIAGTYNVYEVARRLQIKRVITPSSVMVARGLPWNERKITMADGDKSTTHYALSKFYGEHLARMYHDLHGIESVLIRLGWVPGDRANIEEVKRDYADFQAFFSLYTSPRDAGRLFTLALEADASRFGGFAVMYATGKSDTVGFDNGPAKELIGYEPRDPWPQGAPFDR
jgi:nucleoside-diphosphate-sugar epimerase